ncbi:Pcc1-domain-containing protein [Patellaria atrata CBS 101060]|uniref:Pcc1-domain-containing protein n=1 Tax=Patellaria atrata CBS 101060 TaxID=1346257 RepID=A0A9P4S0Z0_9PEZI|nr:Pcc1-domain-containing protein [Patellaria atrata CBS 101060]
MESQENGGDEFPCRITLNIPFPSARLATAALRALRVDAELSPLVSRGLSSSSPGSSTLLVQYAATTNRMLRVAVNGFFESLRVIIGVMEELDLDVVDKVVSEGVVKEGFEWAEWEEGLRGVQGVVSMKKGNS